MIKYDCKEYADNDYTYACVGGFQGIYDINDDGTVSNSLKNENLYLNKSENDIADVNMKNSIKDFADGKTTDEFVNKIEKFKSK